MGQQFKVRSTALVVTLGWLAGATLGIRPLSATTHDATLTTAGGSILPALCVGDCNEDLTVTVNELVAAVNIALERTEVGRCRRADADNNARVTIDELVGAVNRALGGCGVEPNPTSTSTPTRRASGSPAGTTPTPTLSNTTPGLTPTATTTPPSLPSATADTTPAATATRTSSTSPSTTASPAATPSRSGSPNPTSTPTALPASTATATAEPAATSTATASATPLPPSPTSTPEAPGPRITYFGVGRADSEALQPDLFDHAGRAVFIRALGQGMSLIVEARPGTNLAAVGESAFSQDGFPDLQMLVSRPLGDGRPEVCDVNMNAPELIGGVPATPNLEFTDTPAVVNATNDLGCRVDNGLGSPVARTTAREACTHATSGDVFGFGFVGAGTSAQFCLPIASKWEFPLGETIVRTRIRGTNGVVGPPREIVIRVIGQ